MEEQLLEALRRGRRAAVKGDGKRYAVFVPLLEKETGPEILFEVRASGLRRQPGEICFPGGRSLEGEGAEQTAVRETAEELLLPEKRIRVLEVLDAFGIDAHGVLTPVVGELTDYEGTYSAAEVDHVFTVPLDFFLREEPEWYEIAMESHPGEEFPYDRIPQGREYSWGTRYRRVAFYRYGSYEIWGITAGIMADVAKFLRLGGYEGGR